MKMKETMPSLLVLRRRNLVVQGTKEEQGPKGRKANVTHVTRSATMLENALSRRILLMMMTTTTAGGMAIKGTTGSKERGRLPLVEMGNLTKGREIPGMRNLMLLMTNEMNSFLYLPSLLHLHLTLWMSS